MALGREPVDQTTEALRPGYITAVQGRDGRIQAPPRGDMYVRDPRAARAQAIRDRVAQFKEQGIEIPDHLQKLFDELPDPAAQEVELVDAVSGEHVADVELEPASVPETFDLESAAFRDGKKIDTDTVPVEGPTGTVQDGLLSVEPVTEDAQLEAIQRAAAAQEEPNEIIAEEVPVPDANKGTLTATATAVETPAPVETPVEAPVEAPAPVETPVETPAPPKPQGPRPSPRKAQVRRK